jgi:DNA modification methylase
MKKPQEKTSGEGFDIYHGDCLEIIPQLIAEGVEVDAVITDPPYGCQNAGQVQATGVNAGKGRVEGFDIPWNYDLPLEYLDECGKLLKPGGSLITFTDTKRVETVWNYIKGLDLRPFAGLNTARLNILKKKSPMEAGSRIICLLQR